MFGYAFITRNNHSFVIVISLNEKWLFLQKISIIVIFLSYVIAIKYKISRRPDQNIRLYLYLAFFSLLLFIFPSCSLSLLLFIFLIKLSFSPLLSLALHLVLSLSSFSLWPWRSSSSSWPCRSSLSPLSLFVRLVSVFNLYSTDFPPSLYNRCC